MNMQTYIGPTTTSSLYNGNYEFSLLFENDSYINPCVLLLYYIFTRKILVVWLELLPDLNVFLPFRAKLYNVCSENGGMVNVRRV